MKQQEFTSLTLTEEYFEKLLIVIHNTFLKKHNLKQLPKSSQLYGYGNYDSAKPNLKLDLENLCTDTVNGKYLYDKTRQFHKGKPFLKINKYYKDLLILYLGYDGITEFIDDQKLPTSNRKKQLALIYDDSSFKTYYYINYYFGEDKTIIKGQTVISNNWKKIQHTFIYRDDDGNIKEHYNYGGVIRREDTLHVSTKTLLDGKLVEGDNETYYIGHNDPSNINFLIGTYTSFDIYTNTVAGRIILEKCTSKEDMAEKSKNKVIPPYIAQEIRNQRITNQAIAPKHYLELSEKSPYAFIYSKLPRTYSLDFKNETGFNESLSFNISETDYKISPLTDNVYIEKDSIDLLNKGSIVHFKFELAGIIALDKVDIYIKTYYLKEDNSAEIEGVFCGIDNENRLISGRVILNWEK
jgi:hypothetical protein